LIEWLAFVVSLWAKRYSVESFHWLFYLSCFYHTTVLIVNNLNFIGVSVKEIKEKNCHEILELLRWRQVGCLSGTRESPLQRCCKCDFLVHLKINFLSLTVLEWFLTLRCLSKRFHIKLLFLYFTRLSDVISFAKYTFLCNDLRWFKL
jgi:hypothetical protein